MIREGYLRVTEPLSLLCDFQSINPDVLENASKRGSAVHNICKDIVEGLGSFGSMEEVKKYTTNEEGEVNNNHFWNEFPLVENFIKSFEIWAKDKKFLLDVPRFYDDELMITGECDFIYCEDDELVLIDLKTPVNESPTWMLQLSAYAYLARKYKYDIKKIKVIKLSRDGKEPKIIEYEENFDLYKSCLDLYRYINKNKTATNVFDYL